MWHRSRSTDDFSEEIRAHLDLETDRLIADGVEPSAARLAARRAFGNVAAAEERFYEAARWPWLDHLRQDVRVAARSVARYPVAAAGAVVSLAFGIGAMTTTLMVRDVVFHRAPPLYQRPAELSLVLVGRPDRGTLYPYDATIPGTLYRTWRAGAPRGVWVAAASAGRIREVRTPERTENVRVRAASANLFPLLGVGATAGRTFAQTAPDAAAAPPAMLSRRVWFALFGDRPDAIGSTIWIEGAPHTIVGVLPEAFWFTEFGATIWIPLDEERLTADDLLAVVARRPPGTSDAALLATLQPAVDAHVAALPAADRQRRLFARGVEGTPMGAQMALLLPYVLGASVVLTLVIACANVAILMIAQWTAREHEIAIRASLGASRGRVVRALLTESVLLASAGGMLGVAATFALRGIMIYRTPAELALLDLSVGPSLLLESAAITLASGIVVGLLPALYETRRLHANPLTRIASAERERQRWRHALVVLEITVTIALLVETGGMINGYQRVIDADMGFDRHPLLAATVERTGGVRVADLLERVRHEPGVAAAAASTGLPFLGPGARERIVAPSGAEIAVDRVAASPGLFAALGVPVRDGRDLAATDTPASRVALVNETLAAQLFPARNAVGSRIVANGTAYDIVGVFGDYAHHPMQRRQTVARLVTPLGTDAPRARVQIVVRAAADPAPLVAVLRRAVTRARVGTVAGAFTYDEVTRVGAEEVLVGTAPLVPLIAIGMLLTTAGIYGVLAFAIARRSRELAVRVAIGATARDLVRLVTAHSLRLVAVGIACGIGLTFALSRVVRASGGAGSIYDPDWPSFVIPIAIVAAIGAAATWIPSRRATRIDPAAVLRNS